MNFAKKLIFDVIVKAAIQRLFTLVPMLGWGPVGYVVAFYITKFADLGYQLGSEMLANFEYRFANEDHREAFDEEFFKLSVITSDGSATEQEVEDAIKKAQDRMADFVVHRK